MCRTFLHKEFLKKTTSLDLFVNFTTYVIYVLTHTIKYTKRYTIKNIFITAFLTLMTINNDIEIGKKKTVDWMLCVRVCLKPLLMC